MTKMFALFVCLFALMSQTLIPTVSCGKSGISKLDVLEFLLSIHRHPPKSLINKIRELPVLQLIGLVNDVVEPIVTLAEVLLLMEELSKKEHRKGRPPIQLQTHDQIMMFSGKNHLEVNHFKKGLKSHEFTNYIDEYSIPHQKLTDDMIPFESNEMIGLEPLLLSSQARHVSKSVDNNRNHFKFDFMSENPNQNFHLVRDLPKNFALTFGNPIKKSTFHSLNQKSAKYYLKH